MEGYWSQAKKKFKRMSGTSEALLPAYLDEFLFRGYFHLHNDKPGAFTVMVRTIAQWYPWDRPIRARPKRARPIRARLIRAPPIRAPSNKSAANKSASQLERDQKERRPLRAQQALHTKYLLYNTVKKLLRYVTVK